MLFSYPAFYIFVCLWAFFLFARGEVVKKQYLGTVKLCLEEFKQRNLISKYGYWLCLVWLFSRHSASKFAHHSYSTYDLCKDLWKWAFFGIFGGKWACVIMKKKNLHILTHPNICTIDVTVDAQKPRVFSPWQGGRWVWGAGRWWPGWPGRCSSGTWTSS